MQLDENSIATTVSSTKSEKKNRVAHANEHTESFKAHAKVGAMEFGKSEEGTCCHCFSSTLIDWMRNKDKEQLVNTVEDDAKDHSQQQCEQAKITQKSNLLDVS